ncbi:unnamed protein product [Enterobius vermicularis]|uniref:CA domain-containing protein n=1 Tax=Enterobius vermicularis TaxID=51028 RepID=A0A0N4VG88_ENTVE|nr:unnamed protein product [Enterobius vermicularis]
MNLVNGQYQNEAVGSGPTNSLNGYGGYFLSSTAASPNVSSRGNVIVAVRLSAYQNWQHRLAEDGLYCKCLRNCERFNTGIPQCKLLFVVTLGALDGSADSLASNVYVLNTDTGRISASDDQTLTQNVFRSEMLMRLNSRPMPVENDLLGMVDYRVTNVAFALRVIKVYVYHIGKVLDGNGGTKKEEAVALANIFTVIVPETVTLAAQTANVTDASGASRLKFASRNLSNAPYKYHYSLSLSYSVRCSGTLLGSNCDLVCNRSQTDNTFALCRSNTTGYLSLCRYSTQDQLSSCQSCPWGFRDELYCRDAEGGVLKPHTAQLVPTSFRTATIVLSCIAAILLLLLLMVTVYACIAAKRRRADEEDAPGHNYHSSLRAEGNANRPLLQFIFDKRSSLPFLTKTHSTYSCALRLQPIFAWLHRSSLRCTVLESSLRKTNYIPPAHAGGASSINDTLNSSFASSVPMPPSREADV